MIITEHPYRGNSNLVYNYSDAGMYILQVETGIKYGGAVDVYPCRYTYTETDEPIEPEYGTVHPGEVTPDNYADAVAALNELGVTDNG